MSTRDEPTRGPTFTDALRARRESIATPAGLMPAVRDAAGRSAPSGVIIGPQWRDNARAAPSGVPGGRPGAYSRSNGRLRRSHTRSIGCDRDGVQSIARMPGSDRLRAPPPPPEIRRRLQFHRAQLCLLPLMPAVPVLAMLGLFGGPRQRVEIELHGVMHHVRPLEKVISSSMTLLVRDGQFLAENMNKERISPDEIYAEMRKVGLYELSQVRWVVLESDGKMAVISNVEQRRHPNVDTMDDVGGT